MADAGESQTLLGGDSSRSGRASGPAFGYSESPFLDRLVHEVYRKLKKAGDSAKQRSELLGELFKDVVLEVDSRAKELLYSREGREEDAAEDGKVKGSKLDEPLCFYEVLAAHYAVNMEDGEALVQLFKPLWSISFVSLIHALLLHRWLFEMPASNADELKRHSRAVISGSNDVLWIDLQSNTYRFRPLFQFLLEGVTLYPSRFDKVPKKLQKDLVHLVSRFFFYYEAPENIGRLSYFLENMPSTVSSFSSGGPSDIFVTEVTNQLQRIKVEPVLLQYIFWTRQLKGVEMWAATSIRLQVALYSMASVGGPLYPTRSVRHAARGALDTLFPVGRRFRNIISFVFRVLHPYYWPGSFLNFLLTQLRSWRLWLSAVIERYIGPRQQQQQQQQHLHQQ
eukprot:TRINITY_DN9387_c1_g1_i1.p1 TRINITY_DN9387_c1_g1~~TRINITY_DN9387_c1_g1_i1.p1  ORF type:complete len:395 (+),score=103.39 TRINITY_DN9387_c1_g1_i1:116-1300(+)